MAYVVLARKYRPPDFAALVGQEHVVQALSNALTQQRLHHAYLFTGTRGVGKTTISRILAKSLNCTGADGQGGITAHPCGVCQPCRDIDAGRFIDYVELDAASNRGVDEISQLLDQAVYKPVLGRFKVYMVDEVHMLSTTAFNAMLKTLEEPPDYLKFVLATTDPQKVPATVLSRCLQFNLRPMAPQTVQTHLATVLERESIPAEPGALRLLSRAARGSMRDALSLADQAIAFGGGALVESAVRDMLGAVDRGHVVRIVEALVVGDGAALVAAVDGLRGLGLSASGALEEMAAMLQQMAVLQAVPGAADPADPQTPDSLRLAGSLAADEVQLFYSIALQGRAELGLAPDEYSGLVMVLLRMLAFKPRGDAPEIAPAPARASVAVAEAVSVVPVIALQPPVASEPAAVAKADVERVAPRVRVAVTPAQAAGVSAAPVLRVDAGRLRAPHDEPPPWLDAPDAEEDGDASTSGGGRPATTGGRGRADGGERVAATGIPAAADGAGPATLPPAARNQSTAVPPRPMPPLQPTALGDRWLGLVRRMIDGGSIGAMVRELAMQSQCLAIDESARPVACRLRVEREMLRAPAIVEKLQLALSEALGHGVRIETEAGVADDTPARREAAERERRQSEAEQIIHDDPLVRALMAQYKTARIVPGSVKPH